MKILILLALYTLRDTFDALHRTQLTGALMSFRFHEFL